MEEQFIDPSIFEREPEDEGAGAASVTDEVSGETKKKNETSNTTTIDTSEFEQDPEPVVAGKEKNIGSGTPKTKESPSSPITSLTSALFEEGVLASLTEEEIAEIKSGTDLIEVIKKQIRTNEFADLTEDQKEYITALRNGVPEEEYRSLKQQASQLSSLREEDLEGDEDSTVELRFAILKQDFISKGFDEADAKKHAKRSVDLGEDLEEASKALKRIQAEGQAKLKQLANEAAEVKKRELENQSARTTMFKDKLTATKEVIPGVGFNSRTKDKVYELMTKTVDHDRNKVPMNAVVKEMVNNPDYLIKLHYLHHITDGLTNWDKIKTGGKAEAFQTLEDKLEQQNNALSTGASSKARGGVNNNSTDIVNFLNNLGK